MDESSELLQVAAAHERKVRTYAPLLEALQAYLDEGWQVEIFPWVVGVCGLVDSVAIKCCLEFLDMPLKSWRRIIEDTGKESVKPFYVLPRVRCKALKIGPWSGRMRTKRNKAGVLNTRTGVFDADDPGRAATRACSRKRWRRSDGDINEM
jgi:hypothetical protein